MGAKRGRKARYDPQGTSCSWGGATLTRHLDKELELAGRGRVSAFRPQLAWGTNEMCSYCDHIMSKDD
jgi:hypothetical protein